MPRSVVEVCLSFRLCIVSRPGDLLKSASVSWFPELILKVQKCAKGAWSSADQFSKSREYESAPSGRRDSSEPSVPASAPGAGKLSTSDFLPTFETKSAEKI